MKKNDIKIGAIITYIQLFLNIVISILYTPMMLRCLGPEEHGLYSTVSSAIGFLSLLSLGIGSSYIRFYSRYKAKSEEERIASLNGLFLMMFSAIGIIALVCGFILSVNIGWIFSGGISKEETAIARILAIIVTFDLAVSFPASIFNSIIRANENYIWIKSVNMMQSVLSPLLTIPLLLMGFGSIGMVVMTTIVDCAAYLLNVLFCMLKLRTRFSLSYVEKGIMKQIFAFSIFIAINSIISQINSGLDKILLAKYVNTVSVSVYAIGFSLYSYYGSFSSAISSLFTPHIHRVVNENLDNAVAMRNGLTSVFVKLGRLQFLIQMLLCTGIIFFGKSFIFLWAGEGYGNSYYVAVILCLSYTIPLCQNIGVEIQRAQNKHQIRTIVYAIMTVLNVLLTIILCPIYGEVGAVVGTGVSVVAVEVLFMNIYYHKRLNIDIVEYWKNFLLNCKGLIIPAIFGLVVQRYILINNYIDLLIFIGIYTVIYALSMWFLMMNSFEKDLFIGWIKKRFIKKTS